tara:strand:+ start:126 stop:305 length:180 start_codon:yes stop_codon:yes gene_type:complete
MPMKKDMLFITTDSTSVGGMCSKIYVPIFGREQYVPKSHLKLNFKFKRLNNFLPSKVTF